MPLYYPQNNTTEATPPIPTVNELGMSNTVSENSRNVIKLRNQLGIKYYKVNITQPDVRIYLYNDEGTEGSKIQFFVVDNAVIRAFPSISFTVDSLENGATSAYGTGPSSVVEATYTNGAWELSGLPLASSNFGPDGTLKFVKEGVSELSGDSGLVRMSGNNDAFGPNVIYAEGLTPGADMSLLFRDGLYLGTFVGEDGMGAWEPAIVFGQNGMHIGSPSAGAGKSVTITGGEYGITLNPGGDMGTAPVAINGRGEVMSLSPAGTPLTPTTEGHVGSNYYFDGYMYICVATDTWVRAAVNTSW